MMKAIIIICATVLIGCGSGIKTTMNTDIKITEHGIITIEGIAKEGKAGALIEVDSVHRYFIEGLENWPENTFGKMVMANGNWITIDKQKLFDKYPMMQGFRIKNIIEKAEWKIVD